VSQFTLIRRSFELIGVADLVMIELSEKSVELVIEAGYVYALDKPAAVLARACSDRSTTLEGIAPGLDFYGTVEELLVVFAQL
jgi:hypothetical protein